MSEVPGFVIAQLIGACAAAGILYVIASGAAGFDVSQGFAANGYGAHSPGGYSMIAALTAEIVFTMMFVFVILGATSSKAPAGFAPIAIGLCLTLVHLVTIPVTNTSVNPARSTSQALFVGDWAVSQLWLFWVAPLVGAIIAGLISKRLDD
jgi:aquaporin Z